MKGIRYASDAHEDLILLLKAVQNGEELPDYITEEQYNQEKASKIPSALRAFIGFGCSFSGKFFGGYARDNTGRNYAKNCKNSLLKKKPFLQDVVFEFKDYRSWDVENFLIYCDPPYQGFTEYSIKFDHDIFWETMRAWSQKNTVVISEYSAPPDFKCVLEIPTKTDMHCASGQRIEKLFTFSGKYSSEPQIPQGSQLPLPIVE